MAHNHSKGGLWHPAPLQLLCQAVPPALSLSRCRATICTQPSLPLIKGPPSSLTSETSFAPPLDMDLVSGVLQGRAPLPPSPVLPSSRRLQLLQLQKTPCPPQSSVTHSPSGIRPFIPPSTSSSLSTVLSSLRPQTYFLKGRHLPLNPKPSRYRVLGCPVPQNSPLKGAPHPSTLRPSHYKILHSPQTKSHLLYREPALGSPIPPLCNELSSLHPQSHPLNGGLLLSKTSLSHIRTMPYSPLTRSYTLLKRPVPSKASPSHCRTASFSLWPKSHPSKGRPIPSSPNSSREKVTPPLRTRSYPLKMVPISCSPKPSRYNTSQFPPLKGRPILSSSDPPHFKLPSSSKPQSLPLLGGPLSSGSSLSCRGLLHTLQLNPSRHREPVFPKDMVLASPEFILSPHAQDFRERELGVTFFSLPELSSQGIPPNSPTSGFSPTPTPCSLYPSLGSPGPQDVQTPTLCPRIIESVPLSEVSRECGKPQAFSGSAAGQGRDLETLTLQPQYGELMEGWHFSGAAVPGLSWPCGGDQPEATSSFGCLFWPCSSNYHSCLVSQGVVPVQRPLQLYSSTPMCSLPEAHVFPEGWEQCPKETAMQKRESWLGPFPAR